jgi:hypothetical protein
VEAGIGRLLTADERHAWPRGPLRSAFVIGDGYLLTAWHCLNGIGGTAARIWVRLQSGDPGPGFIDVPVTYQGHVAALDCALLAFDTERAEADLGAVETGRLRRHLDAVALPLGDRIEAHDAVRVGGFPERNPSRHAVTLAGTVNSANSLVGSARAIRLHVYAVAARHAESPHGMSGGPAIRRGPDGSERVVGVVYAFPPGAQPGGALGGEVLCRHVADLCDAFPPVAAALRRTARARPAVPDADPVELSLDVAEQHAPALLSAGLEPPATWNLDHLDRLRRRVEAASRGTSRVGDTLTVLCQGVRAKTAFVELGGSALELGRLQVIYRREVGAWPAGRSADALLVEAADADLHLRRRGGGAALGALAGFVVGVAAAVGPDLDRHPALHALVAALGHQVGDAERLYRLRRTSSAWLLVDLGDEPVADTAAWPTTVSWIYLSGGDDVTGTAASDGTEQGLRRALRQVLRSVPPAWPLLVDLAVPHALLRAGVEHWPVFEVDGEFEPLSDGCRPRLRWSRRRRDLALHHRLIDRITHAAWDAAPDPLADAVLTDHRRLKEWIHTDQRRAWLIGGCQPHGQTDPLRVLLREGFGFLVWFAGNLDRVHHEQICAAVASVPASARRQAIPDELPRLADRWPAVIWDDPSGREGFDLPPLMVTEAI